MPDSWNLLEPLAGVIYQERVMHWPVAIGTVVLLASVPQLAGQGSRAHAQDALVAKHAAANGVPEALLRRVIHIETKGNARLVSKGNYGLMQIRLGTARAMGYTGSAEGLLDADTNMTYAVRYLAGAYRVAGGNHEQAIRNYQRGYYDRAKARGFSPYRVASTTPVTQQASAPDPTMLPQQEARRQAVEQQGVIEQERAAQRAALEQQRTALEQQRVALAQQQAAQREAAVQARVAQQ